MQYYINKDNLILSYCSTQNSSMSELLTVWLIVRTGALNDPKNKSGLAHLVEHMNMNFDKYKLESYQYKRAYASTNYFATIYTIDGTVAELTEILEIFEELINGNFIFEDKFAQVKNDVCEEWKQCNSKMKSEITKFVFSGTKYEKNTPIGEMNDIENITLQDVQHFFNKWYTKSNMELHVICHSSRNESDELRRCGFELINRDLQSDRNKYVRREKFSFLGNMQEKFYAGEEYENSFKMYSHYSYHQLFQDECIEEKYLKCLFDLIGDILTLFLHSNDNIDTESRAYFVDFSKDIVLFVQDIRVKNKLVSIEWMINNYTYGLEDWIDQNYVKILAQYMSLIEEQTVVESIDELKQRINLHYLFGRPFVSWEIEKILEKELLQQMTVSRVKRIVLQMLESNEKKVAIFSQNCMVEKH